MISTALDIALAVLPIGPTGTLHIRTIRYTFYVCGLGTHQLLFTVSFEVNVGCIFQI